MEMTSWRSDQEFFESISFSLYFPLVFRSKLFFLSKDKQREDIFRQEWQYKKWCTHPLREVAAKKAGGDNEKRRHKIKFPSQDVLKLNNLSIHSMRIKRKEALKRTYLDMNFEGNRWHSASSFTHSWREFRSRLEGWKQRKHVSELIMTGNRVSLFSHKKKTQSFTTRNTSQVAKIKSW